MKEISLLNQEVKFSLKRGYPEITMYEVDPKKLKKIADALGISITTRETTKWIEHLVGVTLCEKKPTKKGKIIRFLGNLILFRR